RNLGVDLVGRDLEQRLLDLDAVPLLLQPAGNGAPGAAPAELRHGDRYRHLSRLLSGLCFERQACACRGLPASARCASPRASLWVGCMWTSWATSAGNASQL